MNIISNGIEQNSQKRAVFCLSGYGACAVGENVQRLFDVCTENNIPAFTITKPWHDERKQDSAFTLSWLEQETIEAIEELKKRGFSRITLVGNSISTLPIVWAANAQQDVIEKVVLVAPVFDLSQTIRKKVKALAGIDLPTKVWENGVKQSMIPPQIIPQIAQGVTLEQSSFLQDIGKFWGLPHQEIVGMFPRSVPIEIYMNPEDKIIWPRLVREVGKGVNAILTETSSIPWDTIHHNVDFSEISEAIIAPAFYPSRVAAE